MTRQNIIKNIYNDAKKTIEQLSKLDDKYLNNFDDEIQKEADRLLDVYLKTH